MLHQPLWCPGRGFLRLSPILRGHPCPQTACPALRPSGQPPASPPPPPQALRPWVPAVPEGAEHCRGGGSRGQPRYTHGTDPAHPAPHACAFAAHACAPRCPGCAQRQPRATSCRGVLSTCVVPPPAHGWDPTLRREAGQGTPSSWLQMGLILAPSTSLSTPRSCRRMARGFEHQQRRALAHVHRVKHMQPQQSADVGSPRAHPHPPECSVRGWHGRGCQRSSRSCLGTGTARASPRRSPRPPQPLSGGGHSASARGSAAAWPCWRWCGGWSWGFPGAEPSFGPPMLPSHARARPEPLRVARPPAATPVGSHCRRGAVTKRWRVPKHPTAAGRAPAPSVGPCAHVDTHAREHTRTGTCTHRGTHPHPCGEAAAGQTGSPACRTTRVRTHAATRWRELPHAAPGKPGAHGCASMRAMGPARPAAVRSEAVAA